MAVYTHASDQEINQFLQAYPSMKLLSAKPIAEGVENTNYLLHVENEVQLCTKVILTLYEQRTNKEDLPYFMALMSHLSARGIACPQPIPQKNGEVLSVLKGRPAAMFSFLEGKSVRRVGNEHLSELGEALARMHSACEDFALSRANALAPDRLKGLYNTVEPYLDELVPGLQEICASEVEKMSHWHELALPRGTIHADLFTDNVFYEEDRLSGVIDFYFACTDYWIYDLAICLNAWCFEGHVEFNITKAQHLLSAYHRKRPLSDAELDALPFLARGAALRFFLTRANDWFFRVEGAVVTPKDPMEYYKKWEFHARTESYRGYIL